MTLELGRLSIELSAIPAVTVEYGGLSVELFAIPVMRVVLG